MTAATVVSSRPSIEITAAPPASSTPNLLLALADDLFSIVNRCTDLSALTLVSKGFRKKFYRYEILQYNRQAPIARLYGELSDLPWPSFAETLIQELNQRKRAMTAAIRLGDETRAAESRTVLDPSRVITPDNALVNHLAQLQSAVSEANDARLNKFFNWFAKQKASPLEASNAGAKFQDSLQKLSAGEKAMKIRAWLKEQGSKLQVNEQALRGFDYFVPSELLEINSLSAELLNWQLQPLPHVRNLNFAQALINSHHFWKIRVDLLSRLFVTACENKDWPLLTMLLTSRRCEEIMRSNTPNPLPVNTFERLHQHNAGKCKLFFHCLTGSKLQTACLLSTNPSSWRGSEPGVDDIPIGEPQLHEFDPHRFSRDLLDNLSEEGLHEAVEFAAANLGTPWSYRFLQIVFNHPRAQQIRPSTLARVLAAISYRPIENAVVTSLMAYVVARLETWGFGTSYGKVVFGSIGVFESWNFRYNIRFIGKVAMQLLKKPFK